MQGKRLLLAALSGLAACAIVVPAHAEFFGCLPSCNMSLPCGWYVEGNVGTTRISNGNNTSNTNGTNIGFNLNFGYKFMPYFALEIGGTRYPNGQVKDPVTGVKIGSTQFYSYDLAGRAIVPISDSGFELFGKFGVARINASASGSVVAPSGVTISGNGSRNKTGIYLGLGGQYYVSPELAFNLQWQRAQANNHNNATFDLLSLGVSYIFD